MEGVWGRGGGWVVPSWVASGIGQYERQRDTRLDGPLVCSSMAIPLFLRLNVSAAEPPYFVIMSKSSINYNSGNGGIFMNDYVGNNRL